MDPQKPIPPVSIEGRIDIRIRPDSERNAVDLQSSRPFTIGQWFRGSSPEKVMERLPLIFSVCAMAHCRAAYRAFQDALGWVHQPAVDAAHDFLVQLESVREHSLRMLMDWPAALGEPPNPVPMRTLIHSMPLCRKALLGNDRHFGRDGLMRIDLAGLRGQVQALESLLENGVFAMSPAEWLAMSDPVEMMQWADAGKTAAARYIARIIGQDMASLGDNTVPFLPELEPREIHDRLDQDSDFEARPQWNDRPHETTALGRQREHSLIRRVMKESGKGLLARAAARLVETADLTMRLAAYVESAVVAGVLPETPGLPTPGRGLGQVEAARGLLMHRVVLDGERVQDYRIIAPTEWNFHPQGTLAQGLAAMVAESGDVLRRRAEWFIHAVDPCVGFQLSVD